MNNICNECSAFNELGHCGTWINSCIIAKQQEEIREYMNFLKKFICKIFLLIQKWQLKWLQILQIRQELKGFDNFEIFP